MLHPDENIAFQVYIYACSMLPNLMDLVLGLSNSSLLIPTLTNLKVKNSVDLDRVVDMTLGYKEKHGARRILMLALQCVDATCRRPSMAQIVLELERIQREIAPMYSQFNDEIGAVTLGSELFQ